ncbi:hypothetical protein [Reichenbachiella ulvae]|uniref:Uncharacterized protein n=1 Tax=Reichenbachiella ulvae TaxID=2980104 RepID=A0ABT3CPR9_9BACT|nr:hypothetical protein [Reichenbachiella ulvae]MCV9385715.1 hypothetical protein [Reichenbachiella ulvae]
MIYLWRNSLEKRLKAGSKSALKNDFQSHPAGTIDVLMSLEADNWLLANRIIQKFNPEIEWAVQYIQS